MTYINRPLVERLVAFNEKNPISFHVPGHKYGTLSGLPEAFRSALSFDVTELNGLDDLHQPEEVIADAQWKLSRLYDTDASYFLVNGSTVGNLAMIYATCRAGDMVVVQRNAHKSIFNALELVGAKPVLLTPSWDEETASIGVVGVEQVRQALSLYPKVKAVILTYPTYYGVAGSELEDIVTVAHEKEVPVLVDEAHGAHFVIGGPFPKSALELGADVVVHSAHKTLPAMTMASFLHVKSSLICQKRVSKYLQMLQSSSPSYLLMASLDDARAYAASYTIEDVDSFMERRKEFIQRLEEIVALQIIEAEDPLKLMVRVAGYSGFQLLQALEAEGVYVELADPYQVLLILPLLKQAHTYDIEVAVLKVAQAVELLMEQEEGGAQFMSSSLSNGITELCYNRDELEQFEVGWLDYEEAIGKVAADAVVPYPPGIPLLLAGERVKEKDVTLLKTLTNMKASFQGSICLEKKKILVVTNEWGE